MSAKETALASGGLLPDIVEEIPNHVQVVNHQGREKMRFTSTHWNIGAGPLQIRGGGQVAPCTIGGESYAQCTHSFQEILNATGTVVASLPAGVAMFHPDHNHWHQDNVADFKLRAGTLDGPVVAQGVKITYCLIDYDKSSLVTRANGRTYFECGAELQGISVGWGDEYHHSTHGQDLDVTGLPAGVYYLTHLADPSNKWIELREDNNSSWTKLQISRFGSNINVKVLDTSCYDEFTCGNTSNN